MTLNATPMNIRSGEWRAMQPQDLAAVATISDIVNGHYSEGRAIYAERLELYPAGCRILELRGTTAGYLIAHPWLRDDPPPLNRPLSAIPSGVDCFYLHDIALLPKARGMGAGRAAVNFVVDLASAGGFGEIVLTAVNGAESYWAAQGFTPAGRPEASYGAEAVLMRRGVDG